MSPRLSLRRLALGVSLTALFVMAAGASAHAAPAFSVSDASRVEGTGCCGTLPMTFTITLSEPSLQATSVNIATASGTATSAQDFQQRSLLVNFAAGQTSQTVDIATILDSTDEFDETFTVNLTNATGGATIADGTGVGTIVDNDDPPTVSINDPSINEPDGANEDVVFTISLSAPSGKPVDVKLATAYGTASAADAGSFSNVTKSFAPGQTQRTERVPVRSDALDEFDETFNLVASTPTNATIGDGTGTATIVDDDAAPTVSVNDVSINEPDGANENATFTISLSAQSGKPVSVNLATAYGTASAGDAGSIASLTKTFSPGVTQRTETVTVRGDALDEFDETFDLNATSPANATIADGTGVATIVDDDAQPTVSIEDATVTEPFSGWVDSRANVRLSAPSGKPVSVHFGSGNNTAVAPGDYRPRSNVLLTFNPGVTVRKADVAVNEDNFREGSENFVQTLNDPTNTSIVDGSATITIPANCYDREGDTFAAATGIGSVSGDLLEGGSIATSAPGSSICLSEADPNNANVGTDWFKVLLTEGDQSLTEDLTADVELEVIDNPGNTDLDMRVYDADGTEVGFSENTGTADEFVFYSRPDTAADDSGYFYVAVFSFPNPGPVENDYNLRITGDVSGGT